jgi:hypothetical protein
VKPSVDAISALTPTPPLRFASSLSLGEGEGPGVKEHHTSSFTFSARLCVNPSVAAISSLTPTLRVSPSPSARERGRG